MSNHEADMLNDNKGTDGQNQTHAKNEGNRGKQLNPNNPESPKYKGDNNKKK